MRVGIENMSLGSPFGITRRILTTCTSSDHDWNIYKVSIYPQERLKGVSFAFLSSLRTQITTIVITPEKILHSTCEKNPPKMILSIKRQRSEAGQSSTTPDLKHHMGK